MRQSVCSALPETAPAAPALRAVSQQPAVALRAVTKVYQSRAGQVAALREVSASFAAGTFTAIIGASGSGKSTLLQCAAGLDRPTAGEIRLAGCDLGSLSETKLTRLRRDRIGFIFQSFNLLPSLTAALNVALPLRLAGRRPARPAVGRGQDGRPGAAGSTVMMPLSWQTALARKASLAGSFVALALSVGFLGAMALTLVSVAGGHRAQPRWFTRPDVVVAGTDTVSITSASGGDRETSTVRTGEPRAVPAIVASRLAGIAASAAVTAVTVASVVRGLAWAAPSVPVVVPWLRIGGIAAACVTIALLATLIPAAIALRRRPADLAGLA